MRGAVGGLLAGSLLLVGCSAPKPSVVEAETAVQISGIASVHSDSTTSIIVSFEDANGAPAALAAGGSLEMRPDVRVLRVRLPDGVKQCAFADKAFESGLVSKAYFVGCLDGSVALDLHLAEAASARAISGDVAAPLTIQLSRGGPDRPAPLTSERVVLLSPRAGDDADTLAIEGYAFSPFEGEVQILVGSATVRDTFIRSSGELETWGEFRLRWPRGPRGASDSLRVSDGMDEKPAWTGVALPLSHR